MYDNSVSILVPIILEGKMKLDPTKMKDWQIDVNVETGKVQGLF